MSDFSQQEIRGVSLGVTPADTHSVATAAVWFNHIHKLGVHIPLVVVHDFGRLWSARPPEAHEVNVTSLLLRRADPSPVLEALIGDYAGFLQRIFDSEVLKRAQRWQLEDNVIAVLITRVLHHVYKRWAFDAKTDRVRVTLDPAALDASTGRARLDREEMEYFESFFKALLAHELQVRHAIEQLDLDTLRLLALFQGEVNVQTSLEIVDLLNLFSMPMVNDIVNFSLQILPSVLEATRLRDAQSASMDGFEGVERIGHIDNLMLSEFAHDEEIFNQKFLDKELFYYSRSRAREEEPKLHYLLIDASASMRGRRSVFARGVALAMVKWLLNGERPMLRFFDSQLYQSVEVTGSFSVPYLLSFRSERGRHYRKVFEQILHSIRRLKEQRQQQVILYILTHGHCHIPLDLVNRLREVAYLFGVFILPGDPIELEYLELLHSSHLIQEDILNSSANRKRAALNLLDEV